MLLLTLLGLMAQLGHKLFKACRKETSLVQTGRGLFGGVCYCLYCSPQLLQIMAFEVFLYLLCICGLGSFNADIKFNAFSPVLNILLHAFRREHTPALSQSFWVGSVVTVQVIVTSFTLLLLQPVTAGAYSFKSF